VYAINNKIIKILVPIAVILLILGLGFNTLRDMYIKSRLDAQVELSNALNNMEKLSEFRYILKSGFTVEDREEVISEVEGEKSDGKTHIKGEMVNTPVDIYYIDRTIYNYDSFSEKWLIIESDTSNSEELLISELNPMSNFRIKSPGTVEKVGFEKVDGTECLLVSCKTGIENELLETFWQEFEYQFWIDYKNSYIKKAFLQAKNKDSFETVLNINATFYDWNKNIKISPPDVTEKKN